MASGHMEAGDHFFHCPRCLTPLGPIVIEDSERSGVDLLMYECGGCGHSSHMAFGIAWRDNVTSEGEDWEEEGPPCPEEEEDGDDDGEAWKRGSPYDP